MLAFVTLGLEEQFKETTKMSLCWIWASTSTYVKLILHFLI